MTFLRRGLPLVIAFVVGIVFLVQYFVPTRTSSELASRGTDGYIIIGGIVMLLGVISVVRIHSRRVWRQQAGWGYSLFFFLGLFAMLGVGFYSGGELEDGTPYKWLYDNTIVPLGGTLFSILAFFIASAAFRTFRARSFDATLLLLTALIVMFGRVPWGEAVVGLFASPSLAADIVSWIMEVLNVAGTRGILLGVSLGVIATSLKIIFGIERAYLGGD